MWLRISILVSLGICLCGAGCSRSSEGDVPILQSPQDYATSLDEAQKLSQRHLQAFHNGEDLDEKARADLRSARSLFQGLMEYNSNSVGPVFGAAEIDFALGDLDTAERNYRQAINLLHVDAPAAEVATVAEAHNQLANLLVLKGSFKEADEHAKAAMQMSPKNADYAVTRASAKTQLHEEGEATKLCALALSLDPSNKRALSLLKLLQESAKQEPSTK